MTMVVMPKCSGSNRAGIGAQESPNYTLSRKIGPGRSYTAGAGSIGTGGKRAGAHARIAYRQKSATDEGSGDVNG
jgi:hypothetical protein